MSKKKIKIIGKYLFLAGLIIGIVSVILYEKDHPFRTMAVDYQVKEEYVYPVGLPVGIYLRTNGVMVIDTVTVEGKDGKVKNPTNGRIHSGDYITAFNGEPVGNKSKLQYLIQKNQTSPVVLSVVSNNIWKKVQITPVKTKNGEYQLGIWIRDDMQSIGTLSFITESRQFFSLGHGICDIDTGALLSSNEGSLYLANVWGVKKGEPGKPGGLCGSIDYSNQKMIGKIEVNSSNGIWGTIYGNQLKPYQIEKMKVGHSDFVRTGKAKIKFIWKGKPRYYDIEIVQLDTSLTEKNMVVHITDKKLLKQTNGIVQGMSGCPIIQKNRVVGVLTHVMVNHPNFGYGIVIDKICQ